METLRRPTTVDTGVSSADALWTLIQKQSKNTRRAIAERLLVSDLEMGEQLLLKASIERGWQQVKSMQQVEHHYSTLQDLINELSHMKDVLIIPSAEFSRQSKRLAKKYRSLKDYFQRRTDRRSITIYLITIYDKSEYQNVSNRYVDQIIKGLE